MKAPGNKWVLREEVKKIFSGDKPLIGYSVLCGRPWKAISFYLKGESVFCQGINKKKIVY